MARIRRYWNVYRRVTDNGGSTSTIWQWRGKTIAVSAEQAVYKIGTRPPEKGGAQRLWFEGAPDTYRWEEWTAVPTRVILDDPDWDNEPPFRLDCGNWDNHLEC